MQSFVREFACTEIIVGPAVSEDGSWLISRSEDVTSAKHQVIHPACTHGSDDAYVGPQGFVMPYPKPDALRYACVQDSPDYGDGLHAFGEAGFNQQGVGISATVSAFASPAILEFDPLVATGLGEVDMVSILLPYLNSAQEGVELLGRIVETYGSSEGNIVTFIDQKEAWYVEILSGHQWAAIRVPPDKVAVFGNDFMLQEFDPTAPDTLCSPELLSMPRKAGLIVYGRDNLIHLHKTYALPHDAKYSGVRVELGSKLVSPSRPISMYDEEFDLFFTPDHKLSLRDVMDFQAYRFEGTAYESKTSIGDPDYHRPIGIERQAESHILQIRPGVPFQMAPLTWMCLSNAEFGIYLPKFDALLDNLPYAYKNSASIFSEDSAWHVYKALNMLCFIDRKKMGASVKNFLQEYQEQIINKQNDIDMELKPLLDSGQLSRAESLATGSYAHLAQTTLGIALDIYHQLITYYQRFISSTADTDVSTASTPALPPFEPTQNSSSVHAEYKPFFTPEVDFLATALDTQGKLLYPR